MAPTDPKLTGVNDRKFPQNSANARPKDFRVGQVVCSCEGMMGVVDRANVAKAGQSRGLNFILVRWESGYTGRVSSHMGNVEIIDDWSPVKHTVDSLVLLAQDLDLSDDEDRVTFRLRVHRAYANYKVVSLHEKTRAIASCLSPPDSEQMVRSLGRSRHEAERHLAEMFIHCRQCGRV